MESIDSLPSMGASAAYESGPEWESSTTVEKLKGIAQKMFEGEGLTPQEQAFLAQSSKSKQSTSEWLGSFVWTPTDHGSVTRINALRDQVLAGKISKAQSLASLLEFLRAKDQISPRELAGISQTFLHYQSDSSQLAAVKAKLDGKCVGRDTLAKALNVYHKSELPQKHRAGEVVARLRHEADVYGVEREVTVQFGTHGRLVVIDGPVQMMDHSAHQSLSPRRLAELKELYGRTSEGYHYNNMGILLELAHAHRGRDAGESVREVFERFNPDLTALSAKYRSGTCGVLAHTFARRAQEELGLQVMTVSHLTENRWSVLPIPGTEEFRIKWDTLSQEVRGFDHTDAVVLYRDEAGKERATKFACSVEDDNPDEVTDYSTLGMYLSMNKGYEDYPLNQGIDDTAVEKTYIKARFKAVMLKEGKTPEDNKILGIDFLRGNVYMNKAWSSKLEGVPTDRNGFVSISLEALARPDEQGVYFIAGKEVELTHREALSMILASAAGEFEIPRDMEEGLIELARMAPELSRELFMAPIPFLQENFADLQKIGKLMNTYRPSIEEEPDERKAKMYQELNEDFGPLCDAISTGKYDTARIYMAKLLARL